LQPKFPSNKRLINKMVLGWKYRRHGSLPFMFIAIVVQILKMAGCASKSTSWRGPNSFILGAPPLPRDCHGLAAVLGQIYIFGGNSITGGNISHSLKRDTRNLDSYAIILDNARDTAPSLQLRLCLCRCIFWFLYLAVPRCIFPAFHSVIQ
jgi:hypothetical protein